MSGFTKETLAAAGGWAFPCHHTPEHEPGMTLRDWFAGQALAGKVGSPPGQATFAYEIADAMLAERERLGKR